MDVTPRREETADVAVPPTVPLRAQLVGLEARLDTAPRGARIVMLEGQRVPLVTATPLAPLPRRRRETAGLQRRAVTATPADTPDDAAREEAGLCVPLLRLGDGATAEEEAAVVGEAGAR